MGALVSLSRSATVEFWDIAVIWTFAFGALFLFGWLLEEFTQSTKWKKYRHLFLTLAIVGVIGEQLGTVAEFALSEHLQTIDERTTAEMSEKVAVLNKAASEARLEQERLRAANLAFEQAAKPRDIPSMLVAWDKRGIALMKEMTAFPGTSLFIQTVPEFEAQNLTHEIEMLCQSSLHWQVKQLSEAQTGVSPFAMEGIELWTNGPESSGQTRQIDEKASAAAEALLKYLYSYNVYAAHGDLSVVRRIKVHGRNVLTPGHFRLPPGAILMFVGTRSVSSDAELNFSRLQRSAR